MDDDEATIEATAPFPRRGPEPAADEVRADSVVGPYRLLSKLGVGGMGEVWLARRIDLAGDTAPPVALKLLHAHLVNSSQRQRFLREGRILGQLHHPNIAQLLDAGSASAASGGRPYLAIEYVVGERIDRWCDAQRLDVEARLRLFLQVCDAVAQAHAQLVVHRDLKPANIHVSREGAIKLLDFGIAKLLDSDGETADETELTRLGGRALTPEYAAPEQLAGDAITTATDVYALGVVLYALLGGRLPQATGTASDLRLARATLDVDAPPLSRLAAADALTIETVANRRSTTPRSLRKALRGDLDTIVAKAIKPAPAERYSSVLSLAEDLRRHLDGRPVLAQPDSFAYRARKYLRRHRFGVAAAAALLLTLLAGLSASLWQAQRAERAALVAKAETERVKKVKDFFVSIFVNSDPQRRRGDAPVTLADAYEDALKRIDTEVADDPSLQGDLLDDFGEIEAGRGGLDRAQAMFERALPLKEKTRAADDPAIANTLNNLGVIRQMQGHADQGLPYLERALAVLQAHGDTDGAALAFARSGLAVTYMEADQAARGEPLFRQTIVFFRRDPHRYAQALIGDLGNLGIVLFKQGRFSDAKPVAEECLATAVRELGEDSINAAHCLLIRTAVAREERDWVAASTDAERALAIARKNYAGDNRWIVKALLELARVRSDQEQVAAARALLVEALAMAQRLGDTDQTIIVGYSLARASYALGDFDEALDRDDKTLAICRAEPNVDVDQCRLVALDRALLLASLGKAEQALGETAPILADLEAHSERATALADALSIRAKIFSVLRRPDAAVADQRRALQIYDGRPGAHIRRDEHLALARYLVEQGVAGNASTHFEEARRALGDPPPGSEESGLARYRLVLAMVERGEGHADEALALARLSEAALAKHLPLRTREHREAEDLIRALQRVPKSADAGAILTTV